MRNFMTIALLAAALGCETKQGPAGSPGETGPQGPQGQAGPPGPQGPAGQDLDPDAGPSFTRNDIRCTLVHGAKADAGMRLTVTCPSASDIPLQGWCANDELPPIEAYLRMTAPVRWTQESSEPAGWMCEWFPSAGGAAIDVPGATAEICCVRRP